MRQLVFGLCDYVNAVSQGDDDRRMHTERYIEQAVEKLSRGEIRKFTEWLSTLGGWLQ